MAIRMWLLHRMPAPPAILTVFGGDEVRFPTPARVGDRLSLSTEIVEKRASQTKPALTKSSSWDIQESAREISPGSKSAPKWHGQGTRSSFTLCDKVTQGNAGHVDCSRATPRKDFSERREGAFQVRAISERNDGD